MFSKISRLGLIVSILGSYSLILGDLENGWSKVLILLSGVAIFFLELTHTSSLKVVWQMENTIPLFLFFSLAQCFSASGMLKFYIFFELSAFFVFLMVLSLGYQPERVSASYYLMFFTIASSLPFVGMVFIFSNKVFVSDFDSLNLLSLTFSWNYYPFFQAMLILGFLVKFPMYFFHIWLPKAHVEASASGSMILAGILLKLGVYGFFRLKMFLFGEFMMFIFSFSLLGALIASLLCLRSSDLKVLIAYSSVAHMGFLISGIVSLNSGGEVGALVVSVAHGFVSSGLFFGAGVLYSLSGSRLLIFSNGACFWGPWFTLIWGLLCMMNMGTPPSLNFWGEVLLLLSIFSYSSWSGVLFGGSLFFSVAFSMILFTATQTQKENVHSPSQFSFSKKDQLILIGHVLMSVISVLWLVLF